ncbi:MAG: hypothetical protein K2Y32_08435 [Candidatus Obscuribacterales bacterium]|nr:hypothetical protein [Candidatus Obscuribacterales bacterium]
MNFLGGDGDKDDKRLRKNLSSFLKEITARLGERDEKNEGVYSPLCSMRRGKAQRAYEKALKALEQEDLEEAIVFAKRALVHLEMAALHASACPSLGTLDTENDDSLLSETLDLNNPIRAEIKRLLQALIEFKLLVEYKNLTVTAELKDKLGLATQYLQDAIELIDTGSDTEIAAKTEAGLIWLSFVAAQVLEDQSQFPRSLVFQVDRKDKRNLNRLLDAARRAGSTISQATKARLAQYSTAGKYLDQAINALIDDDSIDFGKYLDMLGIETSMLQKKLEKHSIQKQEKQGKKPNQEEEEEEEEEKKENDPAKAEASNDAITEIVMKQTAAIEADQRKRRKRETENDNLDFELSKRPINSDNLAKTGIALRRLRRLALSHSHDQISTENVLNRFEEELAAIEQANRNNDWQQAAAISDSIKDIRRELKALLKDSELI